MVMPSRLSTASLIVLIMLFITLAALFSSFGRMFEECRVGVTVLPHRPHEGHHGTLVVSLEVHLAITNLVDPFREFDRDPIGYVAQETP